MSTRLHRVVASGLMFLLLLLPQSVHAQTTEQTVPYEVLYSSGYIPNPVTEPGMEIQSTPVVQPLPDPGRVWLDGRVSFVGGELSTSERQLAYAVARGIQLMHTEADYQNAVRSGQLVRLNHPNLEVGARRPYALPTTVRFISEVAEQFVTAGCGRLRINDAVRLTSERPQNGSPDSVHPAGMALDLRVINLSEQCYAVLFELLHAAERDRRADVTREWAPEHFHVVVIPEQSVRRVFLEASYEQEGTRGQSE
jgi:Family of unknown function (DUF5715)